MEEGGGCGEGEAGAGGEGWGGRRRWGRRLEGGLVVRDMEAVRRKKKAGKMCSYQKEKTYCIDRCVSRKVNPGKVYR